MINDFDALEKRCRIRRNKRILKISFMSVSSILFAIVGWVGWTQYHESKTMVQRSAAMKPPAIIEKPSETAGTERNDTKALPADLTPVQQAGPTTPLETPPLSIHALPKTVPAKPAVPTAAVLPTQPAAPAKQNLLEVTTATVNGESLFKEYERSPRYESALALAKDFYLKGDYPNASVWSKKANQHNREAEEAWILSAKSYYAQGKKAEAIGVLELFLNYKDSKSASELLKTWKR